MTDETTSNPSKKRKAADDRATLAAGGGFLSFSGQQDAPSANGKNNNNDRFMQQTLSHMERMEQSMLRMEEKLGTMSSVERRCEALEAKCSSLENLLQSTSQSVKDHVDSTCDSLEKKLEGKVDKLQMTVDGALNLPKQNQTWAYPVPIDSYDWLDDEDEAAFLVKTAKALKEKTIKLRAGEFPDSARGFDDEVYQAILMVSDECDVWHCSSKLRAHWEEFAAALKQFTPEIKENCSNHFELGNFHLKKPILELIKEALIGKTFDAIFFVHLNDDEVPYEERGLGMDAILDVVESNKHLRKLAIQFNNIRGDHIERLSSIVKNYPIVELHLRDCCREPGVGDSILTTLLARRESKLEVLGMNRMMITSDVSTVLAEFLATNPKMKRLNLRYNELNDSDIALIANSLRSNTALEVLRLLGNNISQIGVSQAFRPLLFDDSSLNTVADTNHSCFLGGGLGNGSHFNLNVMVNSCVNRGRKIYFLLSFRHRTMSNAQYFRDVDVKILPNMLDSIQRYEMFARRIYRGTYHDEYNHDVIVESLSIVYEVMRKWEKVFCLYE